MQGDEPITFPDAPRAELDNALGNLVEQARKVLETQGRLRALLHANRALVSQLDLPSVLRRIIEAAVELVGARYGALGVIAESGGLEQFIHVGMTADDVERIGHLPEGHGLLGALIDDPSKLVIYGAGVAAGDSTRPDFLYNQLTNSALQFSPGTGVGTTGSPFSGTIATYLRQVTSLQGQAADAASSLQQGQDLVLASLQQRFDDSSGVNIDQEMANLLQLQNSYAANARIMSALRDMIEALMRI